MLVRVVPSTTKGDEQREKEKRKEDFISKYANKDDTKRKNLLENSLKDSNVDEKRNPGGFFTRFMQRFKQPKRYKLLEKSHTSIKKELDLVKFVQRMRSLLSGVMGLLTSQ